MTDQEFENIVRISMKIQSEPSRDSFAHILKNLEESPVTKNEAVRYNIQATASHIINNKITDIIAIWKSKRIVLVPSFLLLLFVGVFSLSSHVNRYENSLQKLAAQDMVIEEPGVDDEDLIFSDVFDTPAIDDLNMIQNEI
jgi:hypothetical protein